MMFKDEKHIIQKCKQGNRKAQFELYQNHKVALFGICMRYAQSRQEAEDILQEGFYLILRDLKSYSGAGSLQGWMKKVMVNASLMYIRKHRKLKVSPMEEQLIDYHSNPDTTLWNSDRVLSLIYMVRQLPENQQLAFNMRAIDGYNYTEISEKLNTSESNCRSLYLRARNGLREMLTKELKKDGTV